MENLELQKRVKDLRIKLGLSQEELADKTGLSLRTIQRIENGESVPRGDTLKRLAVALKVSPDDVIEWRVQEDKNILTVLNLSQLGFLAFPLLGTIIPLAIWVIKKDKIRNVDSIGKSILNFQITWTIILFIVFILPTLSMLLRVSLIPFGFGSLLFIYGGLYLYNILLIILNTIIVYRKGKVKYLPSIRFLN
jgi:transcriptional regulator with XRE-family HTH domain